MTLEAQTEDLRAENARLKTQLRVMEKKNPKLPVRRKLGWSFGQADFFNFLARHDTDNSLPTKRTRIRVD